MSKTPLRILFAGTPEFAASHLRALIESEHQLLAVYTQPDRPAGRGKKLQASAVKQLAITAGLPIMQPVSLKDSAAQQELAALNADVMIVVAYGLLLPQPVLDAPALGCINVHGSLLPRWRGAAPIQRAIESGDALSGITIMQMDAGLDTGDMLATARCPIDSLTNAASLHDTLAELGPPLLLQVMADLPGYQQKRRSQPSVGLTYAHKISKAQAELNWQDSAAQLDRQIRAFNPFPVCFSALRSGEEGKTERVRVWQARPATVSADAATASAAAGTILHASEEGILVRCGEGQLLIEVLQLPGGKALQAKHVLRGRRAQFAPGITFAAVTPSMQ